CVTVYSMMADGVVFLHLLYVAYVVLGQAVIVGAGTFRTAWGRNPWFRWSHLTAIGIVVFEEFMGWTCPLTTWEQQLRALAGEPWRADTFMARLAHELLFSKDINYDWPPVLFTAVHIAFGALVIQGFLLYPPRWFRMHRNTPPHPPAAA
ncbi:MAG: DUF2784 domain-containing protein, partial [Bacteroidales bacterium]|nr:DUF2784 domain-containing protein [Bacteroidales bacterium]